MTQGRVQAHAVVDLRNEFRHVLLQFLHRVIGARVGFLLLPRFPKTLAAPVLPPPSRQANHLNPPPGLTIRRGVVVGTAFFRSGAVWRGDQNGRSAPAYS